MLLIIFSLICFVLLYLLTLYLFLKGIEYKESTKRLIEQIEELRKAVEEVKAKNEDEAIDFACDDVEGKYSSAVSLTHCEQIDSEFTDVDRIDDD